MAPGSGLWSIRSLAFWTFTFLSDFREIEVSFFSFRQGFFSCILIDFYLIDVTFLYSKNDPKTYISLFFLFKTPNQELFEKGNRDLTVANKLRFCKSIEKGRWEKGRSDSALRR